jgi:hypothetical protein
VKPGGIISGENLEKKAASVTAVKNADALFRFKRSHLRLDAL